MKLKIKFIKFFFLFLPISFPAMYGQTLLHPYNLDFEEGTVGTMTIGWTMPDYAVKGGYATKLSDSVPKTGKYSLELYNYGTYKDDMYGAVMQSIDAKPYRGKKIKFRAAVRINILGPVGTAHLWVRSHLSDDTEGYFDMMEDKPIVLSNWDYYQIIGRIDDNAETINFGLLMYGKGEAFIDDASFEIITADTNYEPPEKLSDKDAENLSAFAKLYGLARYYCPTTETKDFNWERFVMAGVYNLFNIKNDNDLTEKLNQLFKPIVPAVKIENSQNNDIKGESKFYPKPVGSLDSISLSWRHIGPKVDIQKSVMFSSDIINTYLPQRESEGVVFQVIDGKPLREKEIEFSAFVKGKFYNDMSKAQLWLRIDCPKDSIALVKKLDCFGLNEQNWQEFKMTVKVPDSAVFIRAGLAIYGEGELYFDDCNISISKTNEENKNYFINPGFEYTKFGNGTFNWKPGTGLESVGYIATIIDSVSHNGKQCLRLGSEKRSIIKVPKPGEIYTENLTNNVKAELPISLFVDSLRTIPNIAQTPIMNSGKSSEFNLSGKDRTSRLAITIITWNIFRQYSLYNVKQETWDLVLIKALKKAALDENENDFLRTLQMLTVPLDDSQARIWFGDDVEPYVFPFLWEPFGNNLIINKVADGIKDIKAGDVIEKIDDKPVSELLKKEEDFVSGSTPEWKQLMAAAILRTGSQGTSAKFNIKNIDGKNKDFDFSRNIKLNELEANNQKPFREIEPGVYYFDLTSVTDKMFKAVVKDLDSAKELIFDLRGPAIISEHFLGFFVKDAVKTPEWIVPVYTFPDKSLVSFKFITGTITAKKPYLGAKIVFLTDVRTNGYSESLINAVKYYKIGTIIGSETGGSAAEALSFTIPGQYHVSMSVMQSQSPDSHSWTGNIKPDILITKNPKDYSFGNDPMINKAVELIKK